MNGIKMVRRTRKENGLLAIVGSAIIPKDIRTKIIKVYKKAGYKKPPYSRIGAYFYISLIITFFVYLIYIYPNLRYKSPLFVMILTIVLWAVIELITFLFFILIEYVFIDLKIYGRLKSIERNLPDYLDLVAANLKGGMTFEQALWNSIRPEFQVLGEEMGAVAKKVMTGEDLIHALQSFANTYDSPLLKRTFDLFIGEITTGGKVVDILEKIVDELRATQVLREEMNAAALSYVIFISIIVMFISPALFALSYQLINMINGISQNLGASVGQGVSAGFFKISKTSIDLQAFRGFSLLSIGIISFISSLIVSTIQKGNIKSGLKYIPIFIVVSLLFYILLSGVLHSIFGGITF